MLARVLLLGLLALVGLSFPAWATGPANYPPGGSGSGVVANTCTPGDFFSAVDGSGNFTCATPAGSGDVTAVGDCASGDCFTASSNNSSLIFEGSTADSSETTLTVTDPTADRTITLPNRTGTVALDKVVNLYDYAACDGTNEATGIQAAITAACALGPGGTLYVPADTCVFGSTLTLCSGLAIIGSDGTERSAYGVAYPHELSYSGTGTAIDAQDFVGVRLAGVLLRATSASFAGPLLDADGIDYLHLDRVSMAAATQAGAATCALVSMNDTSDISIDSSSFTGCGYALKARVLSSNYSNVVRLSHNAFYRSEVCSVLNPGGAWEVTNNKWQPQGYADERSSIFCHGAGICAEGLQLSANMVVDQPSGPTVAEFELCGSGLSITGNFFGGNSTQDAIGFSEPCDGCTISGNEFIQIDEPVVFTGTGGNSVKQTMLGNAMSTVATVPYFGIYRTGSGGTFINEPTDIYANVDTDANSGSGAFVIGSNARDSSSTQQYVFLEGGYAQFRRGNDLRFHETDDSNYVQLSAPTLSGDYTLTLPTTDGATNDLLYNTDGSGTLGWRTPNAGTDITADLEEETHASEHSAGGADAITVTNLASACTDAQVLGGNAGGTGVECQTDDDVPEAADYSNLTAGTGITNSPTGTINATLGTAITSSEITDGEIVNADISATAAIALSKLANMSTDRLLGRDTAGSGAIEELTVGGGIEFTGSGGIQRSAFSGGDVTASAGSATLTIGADKITEAMLKVVDSPSDEECLTYESTGGDFEWQSCGSGGSGISGIAADSGGTTTGSTVTITGTGTDTTRSTDTISVDVDMTEVSLTKGSIWQGNSSNVATAYSNPSGLDVRAFGAVCDGSTDDSTAFTNCIAAVDGTDEGTCLVPATGNACIIADVTLTSNSNLVCTPGARLEAKSSVSNAMLYASSAINNVRISGCLLNLDQVEKDAIKINSGSTGITIDGNQFWWNYNSETAGTGTTAEDYIEMGCADSSSTTLGCSIRNNLFVGSNRDAQDDTGITVLDGGGILGLGSTFLIEGNIIAGTGGDCMDLTMAGIVNANLMYGCGEAGITGTFVQGVISSNEIYVNSSGGTFTIDINASNARIVGNNFPTNTSGRGAARIYNGSGTQFANNYAADGVQYLTVPITNRTKHAAIKNNVFNAGNAMDDPFDGGSAVASVIVENPSDLQVVSNSFVGTAPAGGYTAIRIQNSDTATFDVAQTRILNNIISAIGAAGTDSCMLFHDASGTANNGFINMQIVANSCGAEGSTAIDNCVKVDNVAEAGNWSDVFYSANIFDDCTTWQNGASTTNVTPQVFNSAGTSFKWEPRGMNDGFQFRSIHMMGDGNCVPAAGTGYMGPISTGGNNCNATETNVDWSVGPNQVTFTNMTCRQNEDASCTVVFTLRDDAANTSATCTTTNNDTCAWSGTVTMAASSLAAISMTTNTGCTTESNIECDLTFTVD